ncbi:MAG: acyl-CoA thioesterase [Bacteroidales bacterium]|nr:acyl-CoA thioesterase [Bacteroidales bacterium]
MHTLPLQLRFNDVDMMGHVNNAVIMEFFDLGKSSYFADAGIPVTPEEGDFCVMVVHVEVDFHSQIRWHDHVAVTSQVSHWGNKSLQVTQQVVNTDTGLPCATCRTVLSGYSRSARSSAPIPDAVKQRVQLYDQEQHSI